MKKLILIDGMSLVFRAYHAMFSTGLKTPSGMPSGAIFGFTNIITSLLERENPDHIAVVFDTAEPTFRHDMFPEYKANRDAFPEDLGPQLPKIKELLDLIGVPRVEKPGFEADDVIGTLACNASKENWEVLCLTSDKDYYQLVDSRVKLMKPGKKGEDFEFVDIDGVREKFGVTPEQVIDVLALTGDSVDNVPGVKGIGEKTAIPLIQEYGSVESLYESLDKIERKSVREKLEQSRDNAFLSKTLVTIHTSVELEINHNALDKKTPDYVELDKFFTTVGFNTIRQRWRNKGIEEGVVFEFKKDNEAKPVEGGSDDDENVQPGDSVAAVSGDYKTLRDIETDYRMPSSLDEVKEIAEQLSKVKFFAYDLETDDLDREKCEIVGVALSAEAGKAWYIPVEYIGDDAKKGEQDLFTKERTTPKWKESLPVREVLEILKPVLENESVGKCGQNSKFDSYILMRHGIEVSPIEFDTMVASYVLDPDRKQNLDALSMQWLGYTPVSITSLIGEKKATQMSMRDVEPDRIREYAGEDADLVIKLREVLDSELNKEHMDKLAREIEFPIVETLTRMEYMGVAIDTAALKEISKEIEIAVKDLTGRIYNEAGTEFNIDSPKQLGHILFEKMMIPPLKKTKTGYSTDVQVLTDLAPMHPIADLVLNYRQYVKLKSTYVDALPKMINPRTGRIHTTFNQTVAATGRLSSTDPNLQNIPIKTDLGKEIRKAFVAQHEDYSILSADYSQIELRIMAHICGDKHMAESFAKGLDIHSATASILNGVPLEEVTQDMRRIAKTVNFGIMYGLGSFGLSQRLGIPRGESKSIIDNYFEKYPGIRRYMEITIDRCREKGYAETLRGRRRFFADINSKNNHLRTAAERGSINMPIQGTASDMMKIAMIRIDKEMRKRDMKSMMVLQVHDELIFETHKSELDELAELVKSNMEQALPLGDVPVVVETGVGKNWFEAH